MYATLTLSLVYSHGGGEGGMRLIMRVGIQYFCKLYRHDNWLAQDLYCKCKGYLYSYSCSGQV